MIRNIPWILLLLDCVGQNDKADDTNTDTATETPPTGIDQFCSPGETLSAADGVTTTIQRPTGAWDLTANPYPRWQYAYVCADGLLYGQCRTSGTEDGDNAGTFYSQDGSGACEVVLPPNASNVEVYLQPRFPVGIQWLSMASLDSTTTGAAGTSSTIEATQTEAELKSEGFLTPDGTQPITSVILEHPPLYGTHRTDSGTNTGELAYDSATDQLTYDAQFSNNTIGGMNDATSTGSAFSTPDWTTPGKKLVISNLTLNDAYENYNPGVLKSDGFTGLYGDISYLGQNDINGGTSTIPHVSVAPYASMVAYFGGDADFCSTRSLSELESAFSSVTSTTGGIDNAMLPGLFCADDGKCDNKEVMTTSYIDLDGNYVPNIVYGTQHYANLGLVDLDTYSGDDLSVLLPDGDSDIFNDTIHCIPSVAATKGLAAGTNLYSALSVGDTWSSDNADFNQRHLDLDSGNPTIQSIVNPAGDLPYTVSVEFAVESTVTPNAG